MKIGIIGTRRRDTGIDLDKVSAAFLYVYSKNENIFTIISGGCPKGGDRFAEIIADDLGVPKVIYYANWEKYGKAAGFVRNTDIANESDVLIACVASDRKGGTEDTIKKFLKKFECTEEQAIKDGLLVLV